MELVIQPDGDIRCLYDETLDLRALGALRIERGSHVEPDVEGRWWANLAPVEGPLLGPFHQRSQALEAEVQWLQEHWLMTSS